MAAQCPLCKHSGANMRQCKKCGKIYCRSCANKGLINGNGKMLAANKCPYCGALNQDKAAY